MKKIIILFLCAFPFFLVSQQISASVFNNAGWCSSAPDSSFNVTHSIGESIISTQSTSSLIITQGFLQPDTGICISTSITNGLDWESTSFTIYPNPTQDAIYVKGDLRGMEELHLFNMKGQQLLVEKIQAGTPISLQHLSPGIYLIRILDEREKRWYSAKVEKL